MAGFREVLKQPPHTTSQRLGRALRLATHAGLIANTLACHAPAASAEPAAKAPSASASQVHTTAAAPPPMAAAMEPVAPQPIDPAQAAKDVLALPGSQSTSIGGPSSGQVRGAVPFPDRGPGFYHNTVRPYEARYGTVELVQAIVRAAADVEQALPGSVLVVNDLGLIEGGPIRQHGSHQAGRDADILFYSVDDKGVPLPSVGVPIDPQGKGTDFKDLADPADDQQVALDVPRTWRFAQALIEETHDTLQRIFIVEHVRSMLLAEAARVHAPKPLIQRFADLTCQPDYPHDDHMHIRLYCTPEDMAQGCRDSAPNYPFRIAALSALGLSPLMAAGPDRKASAERKTTPAEAKKKAGPMHALVTQFLKQREAWLKKPSPGRPYCK